MIENARFRNLLKNLGFKVFLFWKAKTVTNRKGETHGSDRFHELDRAELTPKMALLTHRRYLGFEPWDKAFAISEQRMEDAHTLLTDPSV